MAEGVDHEWFESALRTRRRLILKVCWAYARSADEREDLFQEIAVRLWSAARTYDPTRALSTWIYRIALNVAIDHARRRGRRRGERPGLEGDLLPEAEGDPVAAERLRELREMFERLPEADRALLLLHLEGNSHREIGEVLGYGESNVGTRLNRLKKTLRGFVRSDD